MIPHNSRILHLLEKKSLKEVFLSLAGIIVHDFESSGSVPGIGGPGDGGYCPGQHTPF